MRFSIPFALAAVAALLQLTAAHNWLTKPLAYNRVYRARDCKGRQCTDACPSKWARGMNNSREEPAEVWRRGDRVDITWNRNNHHGGMFRLTLVPVDRMWDREWHARMTLLHGCWETGAYKCNPEKEDCGTDKESVSFRRRIRVPSVFPDGDYVVGYVWYGGLYFDSRRGFFPDFYSCSHVRIQGGKKVGGVFQPYFQAGKGPKVKNGRCRTSADQIGQCERTGCPKKKSFRGIPRNFRKGRKPKPITPELVAAGFDPVPSQGMHPSGVSVESTETTIADKYGSYDSGICNGRVCCASTCGSCGGSACEMRNGGGKGCCMGKIIEANKRCSPTTSAPCLRW